MSDQPTSQVFQNNELPQREVEAASSARGFNGLTPSEWASLSKNVWNDLSSPRNKYQLEHGAVFPVKLAERLIKMYSKEGDFVLDPFAGIGTTLVAAKRLGRNAFGTELNPRFAEMGRQWLDECETLFDSGCVQKLINEDCSNIASLFREIKFQVTVTSPPYADFIYKSISNRAFARKKSYNSL
jgi:DNA modification methylase